MEYMFIDEPWSNKSNNEPVTPMGPKHPFWKEAKREVESLLQQAGRVYDKKTIEAIAVDHESWDQLIIEAGENMRTLDKERRMNSLFETLDKVKTKTRSKGILDSLFGGNTHVTGQED